MNVIRGIPACRVALWIVMLAVFPTPAVQAGVNQWTSIGPYGGSARALAADPQNPGTVYAGTSGGVFKTTNGGARWTSANSGLPAGYVARSLVIDPQDPNTVYAGGACGAYGPCGVFKSTDGAASWSPINSGLDGSVQVVESLAIDPQNSGTLFAGTIACFQTSGSPGFVDGAENLCYRAGIFKTTNGGASWNSANAGLPHPTMFGFVHALAIDPQDPNTVYAAVSGGGIFKSTDGGASWTNSLPRPGAAALLIDPQNPSTLYASDWGGIFKSTNGGTSWTAMNSGLSANCCGSLALDPQNPDTIYAGGRYDVAYAGGRIGVFMSTDGGMSWATTGMSWRDSVPTFALDPPNPSVGLAVDPHSPGTVYAATGNLGIFKSADRTGSWSAVNSGLSATEVHSTALDPRNPGTIYAATTDGLYKTTDGGASWSAANSGLPTASRSAPASLAIDPQDPGTIYALPPLGGLMCFNGCVATGGGIFKSTDGAVSWSAAGAPPGGYFFGPLALDPQSSGILYAAGVPPPSFGGPGFGTLFASTDGGASWTPNGSFGNNVSALAIDPQNPGTLYVAADWQILKSTDRGANWTDLRAPIDFLGDCDECVAFGVLTIDPQDSGTLYAAGSVGVSKSVDGGATWNAMNLGLPWSPGQFNYVSALVIDPRDSNTVYLAIAGRIFRSVDAAAHWTEVSAGLTVTAIGNLAVDPNAPGTLYAGTQGGGVFAISFARGEAGAR